MVTESVEKAVVGRAGGMCEMCNVRIIEDDKLMGEIAHIRGRKPGSARYDPDMSGSQRESPENLILLCPACHARIDRQPEKYTTAHILERRRLYADRLGRAIGKAMPDIEFPELDEAVRHIAATDIPLERSYILVPPQKRSKRTACHPDG